MTIKRDDDKGCKVMQERLNAYLQLAIEEGIASGPDIAAEDIFAELNARYGEKQPKRAAKSSDGKRHG